MKLKKYNPTCVVTGKKNDLKMMPVRNEDGDMIGWIFLHDDVKVEGLNATIKWEFKANVID